jgi:glucokinase
VTGNLLAVDVGGSRVKWGTVVDGEVAELYEASTERPLPALIRQIARLHETAGASEWGLCVPGVIDSDRGVVRRATNLELRDVELVREFLEAGLPRPAAFLNDVEAAALGEAAGGTLALLQIGTGVAGRVVLDGEVLTGSAGMAGEIGHLRFRRSGIACACGQLGCVEAYAGWAGIGRRLAMEGRPVKAPAALLKAAERHSWASTVLSDAFEALGYATAAVVSVCDPGEARLGGGLASAWGERLTTSVRHVLFESVLAELAAATRVTTSTLGVRASLLGVARAAGRA